MTYNGRIRKCAKNAYHFFVNDERPKIMAESPDLHVTLVFKEIGLRWRNIAPEVKKQYEEKAFESLVEFSEYQRERAERIRKKMLRSENGTAVAGKECEQNPISFGQFAKEKRQEVAAAYPELSLTQITHKLKDMWKELLGLKENSEEKALKKQKRVELKRIVKEQRLLMQKKKERRASKEVKLEKLDAEENNPDSSYRAYPETSRGQQRKVPFSAYQLFFSDEQAAVKLEHPDWSFGQVSKEVRRRWQSMSTNGRRPFSAKARKGKKEFYNKNPKACNRGNARSLRCYNYFARNERPLVKAEYPQMSNAQIFKEVAVRWRDLSGTRFETLKLKWV